MLINTWNMCSLDYHMNICFMRPVIAVKYWQETVKEQIVQITMRPYLSQTEKLLGLAVNLLP